MPPRRFRTRCANAPLPTQNRVVPRGSPRLSSLWAAARITASPSESRTFVTVIEGPLSNQRTNAVVRRSPQAVPQQAHQISRQHAQPLRPYGWSARLRGGSAERSLPTSATGTLPAGSSSPGSHGRSLPTGVDQAVCAYGSGDAGFADVPDSTRSAMAMRRSSSSTSMVSITATTC